MAGVELTAIEINGSPALAAWAGDALMSVVVLEVRDELVGHAWAMMNPDKLDFVRRQLARA
ncbi:hypothetical protein [Streptomyces chartreusis]